MENSKFENLTEKEYQDLIAEKDNLIRVLECHEDRSLLQKDPSCMHMVSKWAKDLEKYCGWDSYKAPEQTYYMFMGLPRILRRLALKKRR